MSIAKEKDEIAREEVFDLKQHPSTEDYAPVGRTNLRTYKIANFETALAKRNRYRLPQTKGLFRK